MSSSPTYPDKLEIQPLTSSPWKKVTVPGSKSITNRALVLAALCSHGKPVLLSGGLESEDTEVMVQSLRKLGFEVKGNGSWICSPSEEELIPAKQADLFVANSGTSMRFLTAMVSLGQGTYRLDGIPRMRERPIEDLLLALRQMGVDARSENGNGCPPVLIQSQGLPGGNVSIKADVSSQFLSGLLMAAPFARSDITIQVQGSLVSEPYVKMTVAMLEQFKLRVEKGVQAFRVPGRQKGEVPGTSTAIETELFRGWVAQYEIEPDASAASYFFAAAAILGGEIGVNIRYSSLQGDVRFVDLLEQMGCQVSRSDSISVRRTHPGQKLHGIDVDMNDISDTVMTLGAVACFAEGPTTIRNVAHIRHKETDRLTALATELRRVGAVVDECEDGLKITPGPLHGAEIETYNDHRMAMSMALIGLRVPGIVIKNPGCVAKTYPNFFQDLEKLR
jgi:3-phosphoshikimate 1-carboxyvinyltransferase